MVKIKKKVIPNQKISLRNLSPDTLSPFLKSYQAIRVEGVVGQFELVKGDWILHPFLSRCRRVWMDEEPIGQVWIS